jgi:hypothetical protein
MHWFAGHALSLRRMNDQIARLQAALEPARNRLTTHPLYARVRTTEDFRTFMQYHVYAVWDFMSLLKSLQRALTCVEVPWIPVGSADVRYLINEIVLGEESDVDETGKRLSHFELYLDAMEQAGAGTDKIRALVGLLQAGAPLSEAIGSTEEAVRPFLEFTFDTIKLNKPHVLAAVFTFGREDLIPDLFLPIVQGFPENSGLQKFKYYLERHIEVDGEHHSHLALRMLEELCWEDSGKWAEAETYARGALESRILLWDAVVDKCCSK